jgi:predicted CXXCH cytochrome family protein
MAITRVPALLLSALVYAAPAAAQEAAPPGQPPGAVGREVCVTCHEATTQQFARSAHGQLADFERRGAHDGCEACHGGASRHLETGSAADIVSFAGLSTVDSARVCLTCHRQDAAMEWAGSTHASSEVSCTSCHRIHQSRQVVAPAVQRVEGMRAMHSTAPAPKGSLTTAQPELCLSCHPQQRAKLMLSSHHPVREGRMTCTSCHDPHGGTTGVGTIKTTERVNELCNSCHTSKQGPFVFEHEPVEESCLTCHDPHGTVANNLLKQGEPFVCLQCHEMHFHAARVTPTTPVFLAAGGSTNPNGVAGFQQAFNTRCTACHYKVHGSDLPSQGVSGRGKALTR